MTRARDLQPGDVIRPQVVVAAVRPWGKKLVRIDLRFPGEPGMGTLYVAADKEVESESGDRPRLRGEAYLGWFPLSDSRGDKE